jgi:hypothetical protein
MPVTYTPSGERILALLYQKIGALLDYSASEQENITERIVVNKEVNKLMPIYIALKNGDIAHLQIAVDSVTTKFFIELITNHLNKSTLF